MFLEMEHGKVNNVGFLNTLEQELVMGRRDIVPLTAHLQESALNIYVNGLNSFT